MSISQSKIDHEQYEKNGYLLLKDFFPLTLLESLIQEINDLGQFICPNFSLSDAAWVDTINDSQRSNLYRGLRYLPGLMRLASSKEVLGFVQSLGLQFPAIMHSCNIRMDYPRGDKFLFHWHQDFTYLLGSNNSVTLWIPLGTVNRTNGTIQLVPGSHKEGVLPFKYSGKKALEPTTSMSPTDIYLIENPGNSAPLIEEIGLGDMVLFSQFLLHRSTPNTSDKVRWTVQLRYSDLKDEKFVKANYPMGDATNVFFTSFKDKGIVGS